MAGLFDRLEETAFKRIETGYLYQDSPWLIGPRRHYLVSEAEKERIAACIRQTSQEVKPFVFGASLLIVLVIMMFLWITLDRTPGDHGGSSSFAITIMTILLIFATLAPFAILIHAYGRQSLKPLVADLTPSHQSITVREGLESFATTISLRFLVLMVMCGVLPCIGPSVQVAVALFEGRSIPNPPVIALQLTISGAVTIFFLYLLILRAKIQRPAR